VNIYHTGLRELWEEVGIDMPVTPGDWLDENGKIAKYQTVVNIQPFHIDTQEMLDHLFLYRLDKQYS
jgi:8-oxo-dGTP pyrophosphatase MutT (NUDIX family)